ncbi:hypothetical protein A8F94_15305 [Bacillus sp. FJAT-27225]|uniref:DUF4179 domain-containing protein n=1 Tax=Bacillus sp. FJAT-27225 TaxID=1743144 RepID=UPI00080C327D|nr:DUF4179 domain-containing protein [Bacillus sp. FJAT-27225]OCA84091.1 hypothetical protein A8F94_15305 [Bacillus sp. FJAT-27225]
MEKFQRDIENMVDSVTVSSKLDETVQAAIENAKRQKKRSLIHKQKLITNLAALLLLGIGTMLFSAYYPEQATSEPGAKSVYYTDSVFYKTRDGGLKRLAKEGKAKTLGLVAEDKGIKVFLEEGYLDDQQLAVSYRMEFDKSHFGKVADLSDLSLEWYVDGISHGLSGSGGMKTKELITKGDFLVFKTYHNFPEEPHIEVKIHTINGIQGDWSFSFYLKKEKELLSFSNVAAKTDRLENSFEVNEVALTPSKLTLFASTTLKQKELLKDNGTPFYDLFVLALGPDGFYYYEIPHRSSNSPNAFTSFNGTMSEKIEVPRSINTYTYKLLPFISSHKGKEVEENGYIWDEITVPYKEGASFDGHSKFKVVSIEEKSQKTVIRYQVNQEPVFPIFPKLADRENNILHEAISFKQEGDIVEVNYPKIDQSTITEFVLFDASYIVFKDLETLIELK